MPLCGKRIFLYPGDPDGTGIIQYNAEDYREEFQEVDFVDSSQFIRSIGQDITLRNQSLLRLSDSIQFEVPDYQRNYSWEEDQHDGLWETARSVLSLQTTATNTPSDTYFGTVYVAKSSNRDIYEIIDGQQRLATIAILLRNIGVALDATIPELSGEVRSYTEHIKEDYIDELLYRRQGPNEIPFIRLNKHDNEFFRLLFQDDRGVAKGLKRMEQYDGRKQNAIRLRSLLSELNVDEEVYGPDGLGFDEDVLDSFRYFAESHQKLVEADEFYSSAIDQFLNNSSFSEPEHEARALVNLTHFVLRSLRVSECLFETDDQELRVDVFQSLNDRGVELSKMDKVRARIVGRFQGESDSDKQVGRWESVVQEFGGDSDAVEDFLAHYLAATEKEFETVTDAKNELLEAFRLKESGQTEIRSRLANAGDARDFLEELEEYAFRYQELANADLVEDEKQLSHKYREECEAILSRLNGLGTTQWRPFVMYVYQKVTETPGKGEFFRDVLKTVENITFRVAISPHVATVVDDTYPKTTQTFIELEQTGNEFETEKVAEELIDNVDSSARNVFGENFADHLISKSNWQNNQTKQLFLKIADEQYREQNQSGITNTWLSQDPSEVHIEHVLPRNFLLEGKSQPYAWLEHFFQANGENRIENRIEQLRSREAHQIEEDHPDYDGVEQIVSRVKEDFVRDLGNMMLLDQALNRSVQNRLFAVKIREYHRNHKKDLENIANHYFGEAGPLPKDTLETVLTLDLPDDETATSIDAIEELNSWWNYHRSIERKADIVENVLDSLTFDSNEDEFDSVKGEIHQMVKNDYETRFTLLGSG